jgi:hypothetical protein
MRVHRCSVAEDWPQRTPRECARLQMYRRDVVHTSAGAQVPSGLMLHKSEKLAINKSSDGPSAVVL